MPSAGPRVTREPMDVLTGTDDREGFLILVNGSLAAVIVRLADPAHDSLRGKWFLEVGFGRLQRDGLVFDTPEDAMEWVRARRPA